MKKTYIAPYTETVMLSAVTLLTASMTLNTTEEVDTDDILAPDMPGAGFGFSDF